MKNSKSYYIDSFFWSTTATLLRSVVNFVSIPLLLNYLGIDNYGILTLALSTNAYIAMMDIGGNTGPVKFFTEWFSQKDYDRVSRVAGTSITFYILFGILNALILLVMAFWGESWFKLTTEQFEQYKISLFIIAFFAVFNWCSHVLSQLITALEKISYLKKIEIVLSLLNFILILITINYSLSLNIYFFFYTIIQSIIIIPYYLFLKTSSCEFILNLKPQTHWKDFSVVLKYSIGIFAMGFFQAIAAKSRPVILGVFADNAANVLGEYKIIEVFPSFLISICGALITIFLPRASKHVLDNNRQSIEKLSYEGSRLTSVFSCLICYPIILNSVEIISVYVGPDYSYLAKWLALWCFTLVLNLYNSPIASLVLATGRTRMLVYSSAIACIVSIIINIALSSFLGVGSAVSGYLVYIVIQQLFYFLYFDNKIMGLNSLRVLRSFAFPAICGLVSSFAIYVVFDYFFDLSNMGKVLLITLSVIKTVVWLTMFLVIMHIFRIFRLNEIKLFFVK